MISAWETLPVQQGVVEKYVSEKRQLSKDMMHRQGAEQ